MPYTLAKWFVWLLLAALIGGIIGYLLRSLRGDGRAGGNDAGHTDARNAGHARNAADDASVAPGAVQSQHDGEEIVALRAELAAQTARAESLAAERDRLNSDLAECRSHSALSLSLGCAGAVATAPTLSDGQMSDGAGVLGRPLRRDDLTVVEGIGPKIADLLEAVGISTWWALSNTEVRILRSTLDGAGPNYRIHDPSTWPAQAGLLAAGRWTEFKELTDRLDGGRE
jgi:predicted flap endonuclease-1-like 5' DNA nuclease